MRAGRLPARHSNMFESNWALFVCTGNFYRSRFAEAVFNHEAGHAGLGWRAFSRGLRPHLNEGDLSPHTAAALRQRGADLFRAIPRCL